MAGLSPVRVLAVVVAYLPQAPALIPLLRALSPQVDSIMVVDNTPRDDGRVDALFEALPALVSNLRVERLGDNLGIAAALNVGLDIAVREGFDHVLLSDQDSLPAADMVTVLCGVAGRLSASGKRVGCVCPSYFDQTTGQPFRFQVQRRGRLFYSSVASDPSLPWQEIITTISSGMLIPRAALEAVGEMREDFFIDHVDTEWCHRARARGFRNYGTAGAKLTHQLGDAPFRVWCFGWRRHSEYSPLRLYYRFRNFVQLVRLPHVPLRWSIRAAWYWLGNLYAHCLFAERRLANARAIGLGLLDGLSGRMGKASRKI